MGPFRTATDQQHGPLKIETNNIASWAPGGLQANQMIKAPTEANYMDFGVFFKQFKSLFETATSKRDT